MRNHYHSEKKASSADASGEIFWGDGISSEAGVGRWKGYDKGRGGGTGGRHFMVLTVEVLWREFASLLSLK